MKHWKKKPWVDSEVRNWDYIADHLAPDATASDAGKVLTVGETGKPEWGEGGGSGGGLFLYHSTRVDEFTKQLDKTWNEIKTALESNLLPINFWSSNGDVPEWGWYFVPFIQHNENGYTVTETSGTVYITDDPDGLPTYIQD